MRAPALALAVLAAACGTPPREEMPLPPDSPVAQDIPGRWTFEGDADGAPPAGFAFGHAGKGRTGSWVVRAEPGAPSGGKVLAQVDADPTSQRFPVALAEGAGVRDLRLSVKFRTVSGEVDRAAGLVFRARDDKNYYLVRANALEGNVALYYLKDGIRTTLANWDGEVPGGAWTELAVEAAGESITVFLAGRKVLEARNTVYPDAGRVGVWTKADSVTLFDDLLLEPR